MITLRGLTLSFEVLDGALVALGGLAGWEGAEVVAFAGRRSAFSGFETVLTGF
jgi:hypothetical protein